MEFVDYSSSIRVRVQANFGVFARHVYDISVVPKIEVKHKCNNCKQNCKQQCYT